VGQQVTLRAGSGDDVRARIDLLKQRAAAPFVLPAPPDGIASVECDLVARAVVGGQTRGFLYKPALDQFADSAGTMIGEADLRALAQVPGQEVTYTCVYPGGGQRLGIDRDLDGVLDDKVQDPLAQLLLFIQTLIELFKLLAQLGQ
jgi:hypothetical protein